MYGSIVKKCVKNLQYPSKTVTVANLSLKSKLDAWPYFTIQKIFISLVWKKFKWQKKKRREKNWEQRRNSCQRANRSRCTVERSTWQRESRLALFRYLLAPAAAVAAEECRRRRYVILFSVTMRSDATTSSLSILERARKVASGRSELERKKSQSIVRYHFERDARGHDEYIDPV